MRTRYDRFAEFYEDYLAEHRDTTCRRLHFLGTALTLLLLIVTLMLQRWLLLLAMPLVGYGFAWCGHFIFEKNRPTTFQHPFYSLAADFVMFRDILIGRIRF
jgi:hypothetical protein